MTPDPNAPLGTRCPPLLVAAAIGLAAGSAHAQTALMPPAVDMSRTLPAGVGTQNYVCLPATGPGGAAFKSIGPQSALSAPLAGHLTIELADNILAAVPGPADQPYPGCVEAAGGGRQYCPAWRSPLDGSAVYGTTVVSAPGGSGPSCPTAGAVPCLLLRTLATTPGRVSPSVLGGVTFIQRLDTVGGSPPAGACTVGQIAQVPYTATYNFYAAKP